MEFHTLPESSFVRPIESWHVLSTSGWMNWLMTRLFALSWEPSGRLLASAKERNVVVYALCAGVEVR